MTKQPVNVLLVSDRPLSWKERKKLETENNIKIIKYMRKYDGFSYPWWFERELVTK